MRILFRKVKGGDFVDHIIGWFSGGKYSHVELVFSKILCFSSRPFSGTTFTTIDYDNEHWEVFNLPMSAEKELAILQWCMKESHCKYDWLGVLRFVFPFIKQSKKRWFCTEIVVTALQEAGFCKGLIAHKTSPSQFREYMQMEYR